MENKGNKVKTLFFDALFDLALLFVAIWPAYVVGNMLFGLIAAAVTDNDNRLAAWLFEFFPSLIVMCAIIFVFWFRVEYKREKWSIPRAAVAMALACGVQMLLATLVVSTVYSCGPALPLIKVFYVGTDSSKFIKDTDLPAWLCAVVMLALDFFYFGAAVLGGYL